MACDGSNAYYRRKYEYQRELTLSGHAHIFSVAYDLHGSAFLYEAKSMHKIHIQRCQVAVTTKFLLKKR